MSDQRNLNEIIFDAALEHALGDIAEQEEQQAEELFEALAKEAETVTTSKKFDREMRKLVRQAGKSKVRAFPRIMRIAAAIVVVLGISTATVTITTKASIVDLFAWAFDRNDSYMSMEDIHEAERQCTEEIFSNADWEYYYYPQKVSKNFLLNEVTADAESCYMMFTSGEASVSVTEFILDSGSLAGMYDSEEAEVKTIDINGFEAQCIKKEKRISILYSNGEFFLIFNFNNVPMRDAVIISSNLKKVLK